MGKWTILGKWTIMGKWKILAATTSLSAAVIATTPSLSVFARELQPLATAAPEQVGMSAERLSRITTVLKKEIADGIYSSCIDVSNVAEATLWVATRTPDVTVPTISLYPTHKAHRYGMEV